MRQYDVKWRWFGGGWSGVGGGWGEKSTEQNAVVYQIPNLHSVHVSSGGCGFCFVLHSNCNTSVLFRVLFFQGTTKINEVKSKGIQARVRV